MNAPEPAAAECRALDTRRVLLRIVAFIEMAGGASGLMTVVIGILRQGGDSAWFGLLLLLLYGLSFVAGILLWRFGVDGLVLSTVVQALQVPKLAWGAVVYEFVSGADLALVFEGSTLRADASLGATFRIAYSTQGHPLMLGVNLFALACLVILVWAGRSLALPPGEEPGPGR